MGEAITISRMSIPARHRATPTQSAALQGLSFSLKAHASSLARPAAVVTVVSGLAFGIGAPAHAGAYAPDSSASPSVQAQAATAPAAKGSAHTVAPGDTLGAIAARYGVGLNAVLSANALSLSSVIYPGNQILIPAAGQSAAPAQANLAAPHTVPAATPPSGMGIQAASASITPKAAPAPATAPAVQGSAVGAALVTSARAQLGATQDCTILVEKALRSIGKPVGDIGPAKFHQYGTPVASPQAGDLMIRAGHVGIYIGDGQAISSGMNGVNETIVHPASWLGGSTFVRVNA